MNDEEINTYTKNKTARKYLLYDIFTLEDEAKFLYKAIERKFTKYNAPRYFKIVIDTISNDDWLNNFDQKYKSSFYYIYLRINSRSKDTIDSMMSFIFIEQLYLQSNEKLTKDFSIKLKSVLDEYLPSWNLNNDAIEMIRVTRNKFMHFGTFDLPIEAFNQTDTEKDQDDVKILLKFYQAHELHKDKKFKRKKIQLLRSVLLIISVQLDAIVEEIFWSFLGLKENISKSRPGYGIIQNKFIQEHIKKYNLDIKGRLDRTEHKISDFLLNNNPEKLSFTDVKILSSKIKHMQIFSTEERMNLNKINNFLDGRASYYEAF